MAKDYNTIAKRERELEKKRKASAKRERRLRRQHDRRESPETENTRDDPGGSEAV